MPPKAKTPSKGAKKAVKPVTKGAKGEGKRKRRRKAIHITVQYSGTHTDLFTKIKIMCRCINIFISPP